MVIGWGHTKAIDTITNSGKDLLKHFIPKATQQAATIAVVGKSECESKWRLTNGVQEGQLCAGGKGNTDSCSGDSGGPFVIRTEGNSVDANPWIVSGIVSFGSKYCGSGRPGVYTRVGLYVDWILKELKK